MNASIEDIKDMLVADTTLGLTFATNLFLYKEPAFPDNTVSLFETPGMPPAYTLSSNTDSKDYERPSIQVRIRNMDAEDAFALAHKIQKSLIKNSQTVWGDYLYSVIYAVTAPYELDWDANNRIRVGMNLNIQRRLK